MNKIRILIIDDEPRWVKLAQETPIFEVVAVSDTKAALDALKQTQFDLVIASSVHLDVLKAIQELHIDEPMVVTTVEPSSREARNAYRLGASRYFIKSFNSEDLYEQIKDVIPSVN